MDSHIQMLEGAHVLSILLYPDRRLGNTPAPPSRQRIWQLNVEDADDC